MSGPAPTAHTPGPWVVCIDDDGLNRANAVFAEFQVDSKTIAVDDWDNYIAQTGVNHPNFEANARRIVACVNACEGSSTEWLEFQTSADRVEQFGPPEPFETRYTKELQKGLEYMEQRDNLLAATAQLLDFYGHLDALTFDGGHDLEFARAAIKKATGVAP